MVLTVSFALSPVIGLCCHRRRRSFLRRLDASVEASGPHDFAVRKHAPSSEAPFTSTASHPASVTIAIRPSVGWDGGEYGSDLGPARREIFFAMGLDRYVTDLPVGQITGPPFDLVSNKVRGRSTMIGSSMSALACITESSRTSRHVRKVPTPDFECLSSLHG